MDTKKHLQRDPMCSVISPHQDLWQKNVLERNTKTPTVINEVTAEMVWKLFVVQEMMSTLLFYLICLCQLKLCLPSTSLWREQISVFTRRVQNERCDCAVGNPCCSSSHVWIKALWRLCAVLIINRDRSSCHFYHLNTCGTHLMPNMQ